MSRVDRPQGGVFRDLVQFDALGMIELEHLGEVPRDRFAFAVGIGREEDVGRRFDGAL